MFLPKKLRFNKKETIKQHRQMWLWLAKHPSKTKGEYPGLLKLLRKHQGTTLSCFLCHYASEKKIITQSAEHMCTFCPLDWEVPIHVNAFFCEVSYYSEWRSVSLLDIDNDSQRRYNLRQRKILANKIANLKERKRTNPTASTPLEIYLPEELSEDLVMKIGKYLIADEIGTYQDQLVCRLTDKTDGYYIVCGLPKEEYDKDPQYYDNMSDVSFKVLCDNDEDAGRAIIQAGKYPKHNSRFFVNGQRLSFQQSYTVIQMLKDHIIKEKTYITIPHDMRIHIYPQNPGNR